MATFTKDTLNLSNYMEVVDYKEGRGKLTKTKQMLNFFDNRLSFLEDTYLSEVYDVSNPQHLPNLSVNTYKTSSLWWVIARFNGLVFPHSEIVRGKQLYLPDLQQLSRALNKTANKASVGSSHKKVVL